MSQTIIRPNFTVSEIETLKLIRARIWAKSYASDQIWQAESTIKMSYGLVICQPLCRLTGSASQNNYVMQLFITKRILETVIMTMG